MYLINQNFGILKLMEFIINYSIHLDLMVNKRFHN